MSAGYKLVQLKNGTWSVRSVAEAETFHPVIGPAAEAEALYVRQLRLPERFAAATEQEFVIWDVGLGAAANVLTVLRALKGIPGRLRVLSFDHTLEPLHFALAGTEQLGFLNGYEPVVEHLLTERQVTFPNGAATVTWEVHIADFPSLLASSLVESWPRPHAILFDAFSPAKNPAMWTLPLFRRLRQLAGDSPCTLATYSRATLLRTTLLLAGWFVGAGHATGEKEETTIAATRLDLLDEPLGQAWLGRAQRSTSAEPLERPVYRQAKLSAGNFDALRVHAQFQAA